jgi:hypothetical protein
MEEHVDMHLRCWQPDVIDIQSDDDRILSPLGQQ